EALRCRAVAGVVGEFARKSSLDLTMLRRLSLAAGEGGGLGRPAFSLSRQKPPRAHGPLALVLGSP
ncbi:MAG: hypothetical protein ACXW3R_11570, partial [Rhodoplanes sp.]